MFVVLKQKLFQGAVSYTKIKVNSLNELINALTERKIITIQLKYNENFNHINLNYQFLPISVDELNNYYFSWLKDNPMELKYIEIIEVESDDAYFFNLYKKIS